MAPVRNACVIYNGIPEGKSDMQWHCFCGVTTERHIGLPEPGKTTIYDSSRTIDLENVPLNGGFLVKTLYLSVDPYMRGRMRKPEIESYSVSTTFTSLWRLTRQLTQYPVL